MNRILVDTPDGRQQVIQLGRGGGYFDESRVLWDEQEDGPMPEITLGGMVRRGDKLEVDDDVLAAVPPVREAPKSLVRKLINLLKSEGILTDEQARSLRE